MRYRLCNNCKTILDETYEYGRCPECLKKNKVYALNRRNRLVAEHKCTNCQTDLPEGETRRMCERCRKMRSVSAGKLKEKAKENGMCPKCHKEKLWGDEKVCLECSVKTYEYNRRYKAAHPIAPEVVSAYRKKHYEELKEKGICVQCYKRNAEPGRVRCYLCLKKNAKNKMLKYTPKGTNKRQTRVEQGLCLWCEKPVYKDFCYCKECYEKLDNLLADNRKKYNTGKYNQRFFPKHRNKIREKQWKEVMKE